MDHFVITRSMSSYSNYAVVLGHCFLVLSWDMQEQRVLLSSCVFGTLLISLYIQCFRCYWGKSCMPLSSLAFITEGQGALSSSSNSNFFYSNFFYAVVSRALLAYLSKRHRSVGPDKLSHHFPLLFVIRQLLCHHYALFPCI